MYDQQQLTGDECAHTTDLHPANGPRMLGERLLPNEAKFAYKVAY